MLTETKADDAAVAAYKKAYEDLYQQFYYGLTPVGEITVSLTYLDPEMARQGDGAGSRAGAAQQVKLSGDYSLYAAVDSLKTSRIDSLSGRMPRYLSTASTSPSGISSKKVRTTRAIKYPKGYGCTPVTRSWWI